MALVGRIILAVFCITSIHCVPIVPNRFFNFLTRPLQALHRPNGVLGLLVPPPINGVLNTLGIGARSNTELIPGLTSVSGAQDSFGLNELLEALGYNNGISTLPDANHLSKPLNALVEEPGQTNNGDYEVTENTEFEPTEDINQGDENQKEEINTTSSDLAEITENPDDLTNENTKLDEGSNEREKPNQEPSEEDDHTEQPNNTEVVDESSPTVGSKDSKASNEKEETEGKKSDEERGNDSFTTTTEFFTEKAEETVNENKTEQEVAVNDNNERDKSKLKPIIAASEEYHTAEQPY